MSKKRKRKKSNLLFAILFALLNPWTVFVFPISSYKQFIHGHSMKLFVVIQKESNTITTVPSLMCLPFPKDFPKFRKKRVELQMKNFTFNTEKERFGLCKHSEPLPLPRVELKPSHCSFTCP